MPIESVTSVIALPVPKHNNMIYILLIHRPLNFLRTGKQLLLLLCCYNNSNVKVKPPAPAIKLINSPFKKFKSIN